MKNYILAISLFLANHAQLVAIEDSLVKESLPMRVRLMDIVMKGAPLGIALRLAAQMHQFTSHETMTNLVQSLNRVTLEDLKAYPMQCELIYSVIISFLLTYGIGQIAELLVTVPCRWLADIYPDLSPVLVNCVSLATAVTIYALSQEIFQPSGSCFNAIIGPSYGKHIIRHCDTYRNISKPLEYGTDVTYPWCADKAVLLSLFAFWSAHSINTFLRHRFYKDRRCSAAQFTVMGFLLTAVVVISYQTELQKRASRYAN